MNSPDFLSIAILRAAAENPFGITVPTTNPVKARTALYAARKDLGDPTYADLVVRASPDNVEGELWIIPERALKAITFSPRFTPMVDLL